MLTINVHCGVAAQHLCKSIIKWQRRQIPELIIANSKFKHETRLKTINDVSSYWMLLQLLSPTVTSFDTISSSSPL